MTAAVMSYSDYRSAARARLPHMLFEYIDGGSYDEITLARNTTEMAAVQLRQRVLVPAKDLSFGVNLFGEPFDLPLVLGPVGFAGMFARRGEVQAASAANARGTTMCLSSLSICGIEEVSKAASRPLWFQLYMIKDRGYLAALLDRAWTAGIRVLVMTVDMPVAATRYRDLRSGIRDSSWAGYLRQVGGALVRPAWLVDVQLRGAPHHFGNFAQALGGTSTLGQQWDWVAANFDASVGWPDIEWIRKNWKGSLVIKGVLDPADASDAARAGADGLIVSNHGGRQLDGVRSSISALPAIADRVGDQLTVMMDGGIRSGLDVLRALSLGARACLVGRHWAYALASGGDAAVERMLDTVKNELAIAMTLTGCTSVVEPGRHLIDGSPRWRDENSEGHP